MALFKCLSCTKCCRGLLVPVTRIDIARWINQGWEEIAASVVEVRGLEALRLGSTVIYALPRNRLGVCLYLYGSRCMIHDVKPMVCELFPFAYNLKNDTLGIHPWALSNCEAVAKGLVDLSLEDKARFLSIARMVSKELRNVDAVKEDYEKMIAEARRRLKAKAKDSSTYHSRPFFSVPETVRSLHILSTYQFTCNLFAEGFNHHRCSLLEVKPTRTSHLKDSSS